MGFYVSEDDPSNLKLCERGELSKRLVVETVFSILTPLWHFKKGSRVWNCFRPLGLTLADLNLLVQWDCLKLVSIMAPSGGVTWGPFQAL
jgi:hypothetical protein